MFIKNQGPRLQASQVFTHIFSFQFGQFWESLPVREARDCFIASARRSTISNRSIRLATYDTLFTFLRQFPVQRAF